MKWLLVAVFLIGCASARVNYPAPLSFSHTVSCETCRITKEEVVVLGAPSDPQRLLYPVELARDSRGRYFAVAAQRRGVIIYNSDGSYLSMIGGDGRAADFAGFVRSMLVGPGDSLLVFAANELSVFSPSLRLVRRMQINQITVNTAVLSDGQIIFYSPQVARQSYMRFVTMSPDGRELARFGAIDGGKADASSAFSFVVAPDEQSLWSWQESGTGYRFDQFAVDGERLRSIRLSDVEWWPETKANRARVDTTPPDIPGGRNPPTPPIAVRANAPRNGVALAGVDSAGLVWVSGWGQSNREAAAPISWYLEVIDPKRGALLVSERAASRVRFLSGTDLVYSAQRDSNEFVRILVSRVRLVRE